MNFDRLQGRNGLNRLPYPFDIVKLLCYPFNQSFLPATHAAKAFLYTYLH